MSAPLTGVAPIFAISFLGYGLGKKIVTGSNDAELTKLQILYAGAFSGIFTTSIMAPGERIKCLLQVRIIFLIIHSDRVFHVAIEKKNT